MNWDWKDWLNFTDKNNFLLLLENNKSNNGLSSMNFGLASTITVSTTPNEKSVSNVKRKLFHDDTNMYLSDVEGKIILTDKFIESNLIKPFKNFIGTCKTNIDT